MDLVVGSVKDIVKLALAIKEAVETVRENKDVCKQIGTRVQRLSDIVVLLEKIEIAKHPALTTSLNDLKEILVRALELVKVCQKKHILSHLINGKNLSKDLQKVSQDIMDLMEIANFANNVNSIENNAKLISYVVSGVHLMLPKDAGEGYSLLSNHSICQGAPIPSSCKRFTLAELEKATSHFSSNTLIAKSGNCLIYKGRLSNIHEVAIKRYSTPGTQSAMQYVHVFPVLHQHENIARILGYCHDTKIEMISDKAAEVRDNIFVVEEYMPNGSLFDIIGGSKRRELDWSTGFRIIRGIARSLAYIHENGFVHLYLNAVNILLDSDMNPKISSFGYSEKLDHEYQEITQTVTEELAELRRYTPKEYKEDGIVSVKTDVYTFSCNLRFIVTRISSSDRWKRLINLLGAPGTVNLSDPLLSELCHPTCDPTDLTEIRTCYEIWVMCRQSNRKLRPTMQDVLKMLDGEMQVLPEGLHLCRL